MESEKLTYDVREVAELLGISRAKVYEAVRTGKLPAIFFGLRILIPKKAFHEMLDSVAPIAEPTHFDI